jgi:hypothetical protein
LAAMDSKFGKTRRKKVRHFGLIADIPSPEEREGQREPNPDPNLDLRNRL